MGKKICEMDFFCEAAVFHRILIESFLLPGENTIWLGSPWNSIHIQLLEVIHNILFSELDHSNCLRASERNMNLIIVIGKEIPIHFFFFFCFFGYKMRKKNVKQKFKWFFFHFPEIHCQLYLLHKLSQIWCTFSERKFPVRKVSFILCSFPNFVFWWNIKVSNEWTFDTV